MSLQTTKILKAMAALDDLSNVDLDCVRQLIMRRLEEKPTTFRFLDLPAELRNRIYGLIATESARHNLLMLSLDMATESIAKLHPTLPTSATANARDRPRPYAALAIANKQVRVEFQDVFYSDKTVQLWTSEKDSGKVTDKTTNVKGDKLNAPRLLRALLECKVKAKNVCASRLDLEYVHESINIHRLYHKTDDIVIIECVGESADRFGFLVLEPGEMQKYVNDADKKNH